MDLAKREKEEMAREYPEVVENLSRVTSASIASLCLADVSESKAQLEDRCDFLLGKLDDFNQMLKKVTDRTDFLQMNLPKVMAAREAMKQVYAQIDQLEALECDIRSSLSAMESKIEQAESIFTISYQKKIFKVFQNALGSTTSAGATSSGQYRRQVRFEPPDLFHVDDYFPRGASCKLAAPTTADAPNMEAALLSTASSVETSD